MVMVKSVYVCRPKYGVISYTFQRSHAGLSVRLEANLNFMISFVALDTCTDLRILICITLALPAKKDNDYLIMKSFPHVSSMNSPLSH